MKKNNLISSLYIISSMFLFVIIIIAVKITWIYKVNTMSAGRIIEIYPYVIWLFPSVLLLLGIISFIYENKK